MAFGVMLGDMVRLLRGSIELTAARRSQDSYDRGRRLDDLLLWDDILKNPCPHFRQLDRSTIAKQRGKHLGTWFAMWGVRSSMSSAMGRRPSISRVGSIHGERCNNRSGPRVHNHTSNQWHSNDIWLGFEPIARARYGSGA
jgi:hypothetical protein